MAGARTGNKEGLAGGDPADLTQTEIYGTYAKSSLKTNLLELNQNVPDGYVALSVLLPEFDARAHG